MFYEKLSEAKGGGDRRNLSRKERALVGLGAVSGGVGVAGNVVLPKVLGGTPSEAQLNERMRRYGRYVPLGALGGTVAGGLLARKGLQAYRARGDRREREGEERLSKGERAGLAAGQLYVGKSMLDAGAERVLGVRRFIHGTSDENARGILREGLLGSHGGKGAGSTARMGELGADTAEKIKGRIHIFEDNPLANRLARGHANLAEKGGLGSHIRGIFGVPGVGGGGQRLYGEMGYDDYRKNFRIDPDYNPDSHKIMLTGAAVSRGGVNADIDPSKIQKRRGGLRRIFAARADDLRGYLKNNKGRAARGVALLGGAAYLGAKAYKNTRAALSKDEDRT